MSLVQMLHRLVAVISITMLMFDGGCHLIIPFPVQSKDAQEVPLFDAALGDFFVADQNSIDRGKADLLNPQDSFGDAPSAIEFEDQFDDGMIDSTRWLSFNPNLPCITYEKDGYMAVGLTKTNPKLYCGFTYSQKVDLRKHDLEVNVLSHCGSSFGLQTFLYVFTDQALYVGMFGDKVLDATLNYPNGSETYIPFTKLSTAPYIHQQETWWRFRESSGVLFFETSANGRDSWLPRYKIQTKSPLSQVQFSFGAGYYLGSFECEAHFDVIRIRKQD